MAILALKLYVEKYNYSIDSNIENFIDDFFDYYDNNYQNYLNDIAFFVSEFDGDLGFVKYFLNSLTYSNMASTAN